MIKYDNEAAKQGRHYRFFFGCARFQAGHFEISPGNIKIDIHT